MIIHYFFRLFLPFSFIFLNDKQYRRNFVQNCIVFFFHTFFSFLLQQCISLFLFWMKFSLQALEVFKQLKNFSYIDEHTEFYIYLIVMMFSSFFSLQNQKKIYYYFVKCLLAEQKVAKFWIYKVFFIQNKYFEDKFLGMKIKQFNLKKNVIKSRFRIFFISFD